jgi:hypothetical protein
MRDSRNLAHVTCFVTRKSGDVPDYRNKRRSELGDTMVIPRIGAWCAIVLQVFGSTTAIAQNAASQSAGGVRQACSTDYQTHCTGEEPSLPIETACLRQHFLSLSTQCQSALGALEQDSGEKSDGESQ